MKLNFLVLIFFCCVYYVLGETSFIPKGQRAEIFELTDNEVPVFRITLSNDEYNLLKLKANFLTLNDFNNINESIKKIIEIVNNQNFAEIFPGYNFKEILPELPMNENGHPKIDYEKFYIDVDTFCSIDFVELKKTFYNIFNENSYLNLINIFHTLYNLDVSSDIDENFMILIKEFGTEYEPLINNSEFSFNFPSILQNDHDYFGYYYNYDNFNHGYNDSPISNWDFDLPSSSWDFDSPSSSWDFDSPSSSWDFDSPSSSWDFDSPSSSWDFDSPSSSWDFDSPSSSWDFDTPSNIVDDDSSFRFLDFFWNLFRSSLNDDDISSTDDVNSTINDDSFTTDDVNFTTDYNNKNFDNFNSEDFYKLFKDYDFDKIKNYNFSMHEAKYDFKTKNATLIVEINNEKKIFDKITFSLAGSYSRNFAKPGYNLKIRGKKDLFGRRQFKLRGEASEPTYMRTKLVSDIRNRIGMPSLSANYATLYINDEYLGLYVFTDIYKESWIEYVYGEKDTQLLYKCNRGTLDYKSRYGFENENKEATNKKELYKFLAEMTKAKSASDVESIFDLDQYYKEIAVDVLVSSWDHMGHNYYIYKNKENNKWIYFSHDYDLDMGRREGPSMNLSLLQQSDTIKKLVSNDDPRFREIMSEIVSKVFNPATLYPHIDELKTFIRPYVKLDKTPDEKGQYPGRINKDGSGFYTMKQWEDSIEFKNIDILTYALKKFILLKYRMVCQYYELECDPVYLDMHYGRNTTDDSMNDLDDKEEQTEIDDFENEIETQYTLIDTIQTIDYISDTDTLETDDVFETDDSLETDDLLITDYASETDDTFEVDETFEADDTFEVDETSEADDLLVTDYASETDDTSENDDIIESDDTSKTSDVD